jgi:hypothetical protein
VKNIIREPLIHFLLLGAGLFLVYSIVNNRQSKDEIVIDNYIINDLSAKWEMQWKREPSSAELKKLIDLYIDQEILYREALSMNLDHNDEIIKRRLAIKMEFISDELAESLQPSKEALMEYYEKHKQSYAKPPVYTFTQVYFHASNVNDAIKALKSEDPTNFGDPLSLPSHYQSADAMKISIDFGKAFSQSLDTIELRKWSGPIPSGYGKHIVYIEDKQSSGFYTYDEVAADVILDYNFEASNDFKEELINSLLKGYKIRFDLDDSKLKQELIESY